MRERLAGLVLCALAAAPGPAVAADHTILQKHKEFAPKEVTIRAGDTLVFVNADTMKHNVHSTTEGFAFDLQVQRPGDSDRIRITRTGALEVGCHIHPKMSLRVRVTP
jgi:plastocyanin